MNGIARIHYKIDDELHRRAKAAAAITGVTLKAFVEEALAEKTAKVEGAHEQKRGKK